MEFENASKIELNNVTKKVLIILGLAAALLVPLSQVENQINSRREYEGIAQKDIAKAWGGSVLLTSPTVSMLDYSLHPSVAETSLFVSSREKKRGVFSVPVYITTLRSKVTFTAPPVLPPSKAAESLYINVIPASSIQNFTIRDVASGIDLKGYLDGDGIRLYAADLPSKSFFSGALDIEIVVRGTGTITYESKSAQDKVSMTGNWTKPQFTDGVLPTDTKLSSSGFEASWSLSTLKSNDSTIPAKSIGLNHLWIGNDYTKIERAVKYGVLFIALTFLLIFIVEFLSKAKIHPLQYGLIGLSISLFYLLLLAVSESVGFDIAYLISTLLVSGLIVFYVHGFLNNPKFVKMVLGEQLVLSGFFYVLLSLEEKAFLLGSIGLFIALAVFMAVTRRFDWYSGSFKSENPSVS